MGTKSIVNKLGLKKKYVAFFAIVPLIAMTAFVKVPCPICHGDGYVSSTGMDDVHVTSLVSAKINTFQFGCDTYRISYQYDITMTLDNYANHDAGGYVNLVLVDYQTGQKLDTQFTVVEVPALTSVEHSCTVYFMVTTTGDTSHTEILPDVLKSNVACKACSGTGSVALNSWALSSYLKETFIATQRIETPAIPPLFIDSEAQPGDF